MYSPPTLILHFGVRLPFSDLLDGKAGRLEALADCGGLAQVEIHCQRYSPQFIGMDDFVADMERHQHETV